MTYTFVRVDAYDSNRVLSRHRTVLAAVKADRAMYKRIKRQDPGACICTRIVAANGDDIRDDLYQAQAYILNNERTSRSS